MTGAEPGRAAVGGDSLPSMNARTSGAATLVKPSGRLTGQPWSPKSTIPTCTGGLPSVNGPPLSPRQVEELVLIAHSSTAELTPTAPRHGSLPTATREVSYSRPFGSAPWAPFSSPYPLTDR